MCSLGAIAIPIVRHFGTQKRLLPGSNDRFTLLVIKTRLTRATAYPLISEQLGS